MCNCGSKRITFSQQSPPVQTNSKISTPLHTTTYIGFEYTGKTALTLHGNVSGRQYRFNHTGDRQQIDYRDVLSLAKIPVLKKVK